MRKALAVGKPPRYVDPIISIAQILELQGDFAGAIAAREEELEMYKTEWNFTEGETADAVRRDIARLKNGCNAIRAVSDRPIPALQSFVRRQRIFLLTFSVIML